MLPMCCVGPRRKASSTATYKSRSRWLTRPPSRLLLAHAIEGRPMETKEPVILSLVVEADRERWLLAAVGLDGAADPLLCSPDGELAECRGFGFDYQTAFLRHRLCGVLQRGL